MNRNINWQSDKRNNFHHATEAGSGFHTGQIWMNDQDGRQVNGVEIIELDSKDGSQSPNEEPNDNGDHLSHPWSYAGKIKELEDKYKANRQARLRRHLRYKNRFPESGALDNEFDDSFYFNNSECATPDTADVETFKQTCFTILDKLSTLNLDSSSEGFEGSSNGALCGDIMLEPGWNGEECGEEVITYSTDPQDQEKRTVWIYSFQNRRLLSDNDYELVNISSQDTCNSEIEDELNTSKASSRVSSPVPALHVPRLDLSVGATLPNVTEVTEPKSPEAFNFRGHVPLRQNTVDNWCLNSERAIHKASVINWMALSPRERRRHSKRNYNGVQVHLLPVPEISQEKIEPRPRDGEEEPSPMNQVHKLFERKTEPEKLKTEDMQNHEYFEIEIANETVTSKAFSSFNSDRTSNASRREIVDNATYLITPLAQRWNADVSLKHKDCKTELRKHKNAVGGSFSDRVDYKLQRPRVLIDKPVMSAVAKPIAKLDRDDWITEESCRDQRTPVFNAAVRSQLRNLSSHKPLEWETFSPITRRIVQLESEMQTKNTLFKRCISCFKCCK